jgi:hypothetical protein
VSYLDLSRADHEEGRREHALGLALQGHEGSTDHAAIVKRAEAFEAYLKGGAAATATNGA